ncbi:unnamed protein product [Aphanomyces euteiches]
MNAIGKSIIAQTAQAVSLNKAAAAHMLDESVRKNDTSLTLEWVGMDGQVLYSTQGRIKAYSLEELTDRFLGMPDSLWSNGQIVTLVNKSERAGFPYYLLVSVPSEALKPSQFYIYYRDLSKFATLGVPLLLYLLTPYLFALGFFSTINRRLRKLNRALQQMDLHGEPLKLEEASKDEIGKLNRLYNSMALRIQTQMAQIREIELKRNLLLSNLSHDLRTPLTIILGYTETIRTAEAMGHEELQGYIRIILQRSRYMDRLLNQLLDISNLETKSLEIHREPHNLSELVRKIAADYTLIVDEQKVDFVVDIPEPDAFAEIDHSLIERAVRNLIDNALRHGMSRDYLEIGVASKQTHVVVRVKDKGKGILPKDQELIFERFYQLDQSRKDGLGLGLSIVKEIAAGHEGRIYMESEPMKGTVFYLELPLP